MHLRQLTMGATQAPPGHMVAVHLEIVAVFDDSCEMD